MRAGWLVVGFLISVAPLAEAQTITDGDTIKPVSYTHLTLPTTPYV